MTALPSLRPVIGIAEVEAGRARRRIRLLDVRWRLDLPEGRPAYLAGHLPDAVYVDLEQELTRPGHPEEGRHPLPALADLERAARRWGSIKTTSSSSCTTITTGSRPLARGGCCGVDIRVLDGGLRAWIAGGKEISRGDVLPAEGSIRLKDVDPGVASIDDVARVARAAWRVPRGACRVARAAWRGSDKCPVAAPLPGCRGDSGSSCRPHPGRDQRSDALAR
jgi:thiosulfate/3-mercaptopyruvate sulfurtransferase